MRLVDAALSVLKTRPSILSGDVLGTGQRLFLQVLINKISSPHRVARLAASRGPKVRDLMTVRAALHLLLALTIPGSIRKSKLALML